MDNKIIVLSGMPASGKDTVSERLHQMNQQYVYFKKHRSVGQEDKPKDSYYNITKDEFDRKIKNGAFLQYHERYGRYYGIDKKILLDMLKNGQIPIIHIGRIENFFVFQKNLSSFIQIESLNIRIIHIQLWETEQNLLNRIIARDKLQNEIAKRTAAMKQEFLEVANLLDSGDRPFTLVIKNEDIEKTCNLIISSANNDVMQNDGYDEFCKYLSDVRGKNEK